MANFEGPYSWSELPPANATEDDWAAFKSRAFDELCELVQQADREFRNDPHGRVERIHQFRREHHLIVVADRIRRCTAAPVGLSGCELRREAAFVVDRSAYVMDGRAG